MKCRDWWLKRWQQQGVTGEVSRRDEGLKSSADREGKKLSASEDAQPVRLLQTESHHAVTRRGAE